MLALAVAAADAQTRPQQLGTVRVTVKDPSGAVIPGATVQLTRADDRRRRSAAPTLPAGHVRWTRRRPCERPCARAISSGRHLSRFRTARHPGASRAGGGQPQGGDARDPQDRRERRGRPRSGRPAPPIRGAIASARCSRVNRSMRCPTIPTRWRRCSRRWPGRAARSGSTASAAASCRRNRRSARSGSPAGCSRPRTTAAA